MTCPRSHSKSERGRATMQIHSTSLFSSSDAFQRGEEHTHKHFLKRTQKCGHPNIFLYKHTHIHTPLGTHISQRHSLTSAHKSIKAPVYMYTVTRDTRYTQLLRTSSHAQIQTHTHTHTDKHLEQRGWDPKLETHSIDKEGPTQLRKALLLGQPGLSLPPTPVSALEGQRSLPGVLPHMGKGSPVSRIPGKYGQGVTLEN